MKGERTNRKLLNIKNDNFIRFHYKVTHLLKNLRKRLLSRYSMVDPKLWIGRPIISNTNIQIPNTMHQLSCDVIALEFKIIMMMERIRKFIALKQLSLSCVTCVNEYLVTNVSFLVALKFDRNDPESCEPRIKRSRNLNLFIVDLLSFIQVG